MATFRAGSRASAVALLVNPNNLRTELIIRSVQETAREKKVQLHVLKAGDEAEFETAFASPVELGGARF
jgi:hypothetical protein